MGENVSLHHLELTTQRAMNRMNQPSNLDRHARLDCSHGGHLKRDAGLGKIGLTRCFMLHFRRRRSFWLINTLQYVSDLAVKMFKPSSNTIRQASQRGASRLAVTVHAGRPLSTSLTRFGEQVEGQEESRKSRLQKLLLNIPPEYQIPGMGELQVLPGQPV